MKTFNKTIFLCGLLLGSSHVLAQTVTLGTPSPSSAGPGGVVTVPVNFTAGATAVGGLTIDIIVDTAQFSNVDVAAGCPGHAISAALAVCNEPDGAAGGRIRLNFAGDSENAFTSGFMANLSLTVAPGAIPDPTELIDAVIIGAGNVSGSGDVALNLITMVDTTLNIQGPVFISSPEAGGGTEFIFGPVIQNAALASQDLVITNTGVGTLSGTCTEGADAGNVFTVTNGAYSAGAGLNDTVTVACDSAGPIDTHTGSMSCTHNGGNVVSPVEYQFSCQITDGPKPAFSSSNPTAGGAITLAVVEAGDPNPSQSLTITNSGDATTTLTGSCAVSGDSEITVSSTAQFNILQGAAGVQRTVTCDASVQGDYTGTLTCTHNGSNASPVEYAVSCTVPEAGSAVFASNPVPGPIDVDSGADVVEGDAAPTRMLTFFNNADQGDQNLGVVCDLSGDSEISVSPTGTLDILIGPQTSTPVTFTCDTAIAGDFNATYSCFHKSAGVDQPVADLPNAVYNLSCEVREPETDVEPTVPDGTTLTFNVSPGGSETRSVGFEELLDEDLKPNDAFISLCEINGTDKGRFSITAPSFPAEIGSGETVNVTVEGSDDGSKDSYSASLDCAFTDSSKNCQSEQDSTEGIDACGTLVSYPLVMNVGGDARFTVLKDFTDGNPGAVTVELDCDTGLILDQKKTITEDGVGVTFVVSSFDTGKLNCNVTERPVDGYSATYKASGDSSNTDSDDAKKGCFYTTVAGGDENLCQITNTPNLVDFTVTKNWIIEGQSSDLDLGYRIRAWCDGDSLVDQTSVGPASKVHTFSYRPKYPTSKCYATETSNDPSVETTGNCGGPNTGLTISAGKGASCTFTNTVFFEGIPTLSQYGMALMALLMLGMGFVAVRRIV